MSVALTLTLTAGPTLLLADLTLHLWTGVAFTVALATHLALHRRSLTMWPGGWAARRVRTFVRGSDALRELVAVAVVLTGLSLAGGWPGETLHVVAGLVLVPLAIWHTAGHRRWFPRLLRRGLVR